MPALPTRRRAKPFALQSALKHKRTHAVLLRYARKRAAYNASAALVLAITLSYYLPAIRLWRAERYRIGARKGNRLRQRRWRKRKKLLARIERIQTKRIKLREQIATLEARVAKREYHRRRCAKAHQGTVDGFGAAIPMDAAQLKALHFSKRYSEAYLAAVLEKQRWLAALAKQNTPVVQPRTIQL